MKCGTKMAKGGGVEYKGKTKGKMVKMAMGGMPPQAAGRMRPERAMRGAPMMKKGGSVSKRADGVATKGKTNCKVM